MKRKKIAITIRSFDADGSNLDKLRSHFNITYLNMTKKRLASEELIAAIRGAEGVIAGTEQFTGQVIRNSADLKVISRVGVGIDNIDMDAARTAGIRVMNTPDAPADAVAEHTLTLILCCLKNACMYNAAARERSKSPGIPAGLLLKGRVCGIIGMGRIGKKVAAILRSFGSRVMYYDPYVTLDPEPGITRADTLGELLTVSDIITLHIPSLGGSEQIISRRTLPLCKDGVILINTARGSHIDEDVLVKGLQEKKILAAGLDVFAKEPYSGPLVDFPQVVITPHVASNTVESRKKMEEEAVENLITAMEWTES